MKLSDLETGDEILIRATVVSDTIRPPVVRMKVGGVNYDVCSDTEVEKVLHRPIKVGNTVTSVRNSNKTVKYKILCIDKEDVFLREIHTDTPYTCKLSFLVLDKS